MADEKPAKDKDKDESLEEQPFGDRKRNLLTVAVVGGLMLLEGVGIVGAVKFLGVGPQETEASEEVVEEVDQDGNPLPPQIEMRVTDVVAFNSKGGRVFVYQLSVYAEVDSKKMADVEDILENRQNTIEDHFSKIIRACDPKYLEEPGLETLKRQFKRELDEVLGDETLINEVIFPQFSKSRAD